MRVPRVCRECDVAVPRRIIPLALPRNGRTLAAVLAVAAGSDAIVKRDQALT